MSSGNRWLGWQQVNMNIHIFPAFVWRLGVGVVLGGAASASALQVNRSSDTAMHIDTANNVYCSYASYQIVNNDGVAYSNLWVKIDSFSGTTIRLAGGDPGLCNLGNLAASQTNTVFFYLHATNTTAAAETHNIKIYRGHPSTGVALTTNQFSLTVGSAGQNSSQKINSAAASPNPATVGGLFTVTLMGETGTIGGANQVNFTPSVYTNWNALSYQLVTSSVVVSGGNSGTYSNTLWVALSASQNTYYTNTYWFRALAVAGSNQVSPLSIQTGGGGNFTHAPPPSAGVLPAIQPATNMTVMANFANVTQLYTNETVTYTIRFTNSSSSAVFLDSVVDTLPPGFAYVTNSSYFNGSAAANPATSSQTLTWSEPYQIPAASSRELTFQAIPSTSGYATNSCVAYVGTTRLDTTFTTTDNVPATNTLRVLLAPTAIADTGTTLEDAALSTPASGVLANDSEPNGFTLTVSRYTQPAHGSVTMTNNGGYTYIPTADYNGSDSFTYTLTNSNGRASTGAVSLTITAVNDPPSFTKGGNQTVLEDAGAQTITGWATAISVGPTDESGQTLTFHVSNNNTTLFSAQPAIAVNGTLTYTPAANSNGTATVSVYLTDNGGTANSGSDTSATQTFTITITAVNDPPVVGAVTYSRAWGTALRIAKSDLLTCASDAEGDPLVIAWAGGSTNGTAITTNANFVLFGPSNNLSESFLYAASDGTVAITNWINVVVTNATSSVNSISSSNGESLTLRFAGVPGYVYVVERATSVSGPWTALDGTSGTPDSRTNAPADGLWSFTDASPPSPSFYRTRQNN
jgi:uncharacterized repeat protein (TIGR01451 family)